MGLSEDEIEARLAGLRRQREALDREIADLVLYLELGRRLRGAGSGASIPHSIPVPDPGVSGPPDRAARSVPGLPEVALRAGPVASDSGPSAPIPPAVAFTEDAAGARRYGRALVEAACGAILSAGRPLHAGEILEILLARGFTLPGRDPVAALNTRLWKRAGPGGPLRRVAEATYALAGEVESGWNRDPDADGPG